jgi:GTPase
MQESHEFKAGYISIIGKPNAGKSTLLNALLKEKLAIVSPKVQTTRHRIMGIITEKDYQIVFSDTPGILEPEYGMHKRMMSQVKQSLKDADLVIYLIDINDKIDVTASLLKSLRVTVPAIAVLNKIDKLQDDSLEEKKAQVRELLKVEDCYAISALEELGTDDLLKKVITYLPEHLPYYGDEDISDRPMRFFVGELIREQLFFLLEEELPYHSAVLVEQYEEKNTLTKIIASIIVTRETQKGIIIGKNGSMIKKIGSEARARIESFIDRKVFLELHVKVRPDWRNKENFLNEYGY